jgi:hypothetical protein
VEGLGTRYDQREVLRLDSSGAGFYLRSSGFTGSTFPLSVLPTVPLLMFTACSSTYLSRVAADAGIHAVIDKSEGVTALVSTIQKVLPQAGPPATAA